MDVVEIDFRDAALAARYDRLFAACPDAFVQQSHSWCEAICRLGPDRPLFLLCHDEGEDVAGLPLYLFEHDLGNVLTSVPQPGPMGGVFCREGLSVERMAEVYGNLLAAAARIAQRHGCMTLSLITNPFADDLPLYERFLQPDFVLENFLQAIDLEKVFSPAGEFLPVARRNNLSRNLRKSGEAGFTVGLCQLPERLRDWHAIHVQRHTELGATPLSLELFEKLFTVLVPRGQAGLILVEKDGQIASGCLFVYHHRIMDVFMLSVNSAWEEHAPNFANVRFSLDWARSLGVRQYNWQSSTSRAGGVYRFKQQWGSVEYPYYFVTKLFCPIERLRQIGPEGVRRHYPWHYVMPWQAFESDCSARSFRKP
jgi:hypothetical protein